MSIWARTALWASVVAAVGFFAANATPDEDGIMSAELAGAATSAVFSLPVILALWPSTSRKAAPYLALRAAGGPTFSLTQLRSSRRSKGAGPWATYDHSLSPENSP
jgi:hypothetical protein